MNLLSVGFFLRYNFLFFNLILLLALQKPRKVAPLYDSDSEADISDTELTGDDSDNNVIEESFESTHVVRDSFGGSIGVYL